MATKKVRCETKKRDAQRPKIASSIPSKSVRSIEGKKQDKYGTGVRGRTIDSVVFENLCRKQCTQQEIASVLGVSDMTIREWVRQHYFDENGNPMEYMDVWKDLAREGLSELRLIQFKQAINNPTMAIWLGKQYLGQSDRVENTNNEKVEFINDIPKVDE